MNEWHVPQLSAAQVKLRAKARVIVYVGAEYGMTGVGNVIL